MMQSATVMNKPVKSATSETIAVRLLQVSGNESNRRKLDYYLRSTNWAFKHVSDFDEACEELQSGKGYSVVVCDSRIPSAHWSAVHREARRIANAPAFVLAAPIEATEEWTSALNVGADVLATPFNQEEVTCVISQAHNCWLRWARLQQDHRLNGAA